MKAVQLAGESLPHVEAAKFDALQFPSDALIAEYAAITTTKTVSDQRPPLPGNVEAFRVWLRPADARVCFTTWQHTTVVMYLDVQSVPLACTWVRCSASPNADICSVMPLFEASFERDGRSLAAVERLLQINRQTAPACPETPVLEREVSVGGSSRYLPEPVSACGMVAEIRGQHDSEGSDQ